MDIVQILAASSMRDGSSIYLEAVEKVAAAIERLAQSHFDAGTRALRQAQHAQASEQPHYLREARSRFNQAVSLEIHERLALSHLGLALCHSYLGEYHNAQEALKAILDVRITCTVGGAGGGVVAGAIAGSAILPVIGTFIGAAVGGALAQNAAEKSWYAQNQHRLNWLSGLQEDVKTICASWSLHESQMRERERQTLRAAEKLKQPETLKAKPTGCFGILVLIGLVVAALVGTIAWH